MSIQVTTLKGTNSISSDRITINDNFSINTDAINDLLGILNTTTGLFDNTGIGANSTIVTEGLTVSLLGIDIGATGSLSINDGNIIISDNSQYIRMGQDFSYIKDTIIAPTKHVIDFSDGFEGVAVPKKTTTELNTISGFLAPFGATAPNMIAFDTVAGKFKGWDSVNMVFVDLS